MVFSKKKLIALSLPVIFINYSQAGAWAKCCVPAKASIHASFATSNSKRVQMFAKLQIQYLRTSNDLVALAASNTLNNEKGIDAHSERYKGNLKQFQSLLEQKAAHVTSEWVKSNYPAGTRNASCSPTTSEDKFNSIFTKAQVQKQLASAVVSLAMETDKFKGDGTTNKFTKVDSYHIQGTKWAKRQSVETGELFNNNDNKRIYVNAIAKHWFNDVYKPKKRKTSADDTYNFLARELSVKQSQAKKILETKNVRELNLGQKEYFERLFTYHSNGNWKPTKARPSPETQADFEDSLVAMYFEGQSGTSYSAWITSLEDSSLDKMLISQATVSNYLNYLENKAKTETNNALATLVSHRVKEHEQDLLNKRRLDLVRVKQK